LRAIASFTAKTWGHDQAKRYSHSFEVCFSLLASQPELGRACDGIRKGLRQHEHGKHIVFYRLTERGVRILRVMHQQRLPDTMEIGW
jgi:toxin ParE1/3/4